MGSLTTIPRGRALRRRSLYFSLVGATTLAGTLAMAGIADANGWTAIEIATVLLFAITFGWVSLSFWSAAIGFVVQLFARDPVAVAAPIARDADGDAPITTRTALVMPIYNEDPEQVFAGLDATYRSLAETGFLDRFDIFVLSDTTDPERGAIEERYFEAWRQGAAGAHRLHYRRRARNIGRKAGNIADFCDRWGAGFDHFVVLDADSVMTGRAIVRLVRMMQANPEAGIIQTLPMVVGQTTLFSRILQFAGRIGGETTATGAAYWQMGEGNYFGHNAIIRTAPFMAHCELPVLPGSGPLAGEILSHDFVEAAYMRRAGYQVWMVPESGGSYETLPPNLPAYVKRDRRWCQGNLQHTGLLTEGGLHPLSRLHLAMGILSYLTAPIWLALLLLGLADIVDQAVTGRSYFEPGYNLFPVWPITKTDQAIGLFVATIAMLLMPKILGLIVVLIRKAERRSHGGAVRVVTSALVETVATALLAPVMMVFRSMFVVATLFGRTVGWDSQARAGRPVPWAEALRGHTAHLILAVAMATSIGLSEPGYLWWLSPVLAGLALAVPLTVFAGRSDLGIGSARLGLFLVPEEVLPSLELRRAHGCIAIPRGLERDRPQVAVPETLGNMALAAPSGRD